MARFDTLHEYGSELERRIRLQTFPLAVKLLRNEADIPEETGGPVRTQSLRKTTEGGPGYVFEKAIRPLRDLGYRVPLCQGFAMSRKEGLTVAMFQEDMVCFEPIVGYGWVKPPLYFLDGHNRYPQDVKNLEAGRNYASDFPRLDVGRYKGVLSAPIARAHFEPDVIMLYCDSAQLSLLLLGREYQKGHDLSCHLSSHAACVYSVVPVMKTREYQVAVPCRGDRYFALASDVEIIFSFPGEKFEDLMDGLRHLEKYNSRLPRLPAMMREPIFPESYVKILGIITGGEQE